METGKYITAESIQAESKEDVFKLIKDKVDIFTARLNTGAATNKEPVTLNKGGGSDLRWLNWTGWGLMGIGACGGALGYYFDTQASAAYNSAKSSYSVDEVNLATQYVQDRNTTYIVSGAVFGAGLILALIPWPSGQPVSVFAGPDYIGFAYRF